MKHDKQIKLPPKPVLPWKPVKWEEMPQLPWPHKMINFASSWSYFYPCKQCGFCCQNPPLVKIIDDKAYYLPKGKDGYCIMFDKEKKLCKIYEERPMECRLLVCRAPESARERLEFLLLKFLKEYGAELEEKSKLPEPDTSVISLQGQNNIRSLP